jgi:hypothetical protein
LFLTDHWRWGYAVGFGLGLIVWLWAEPPFCLAAALGTYGFACLGLRRSLANFPWDVKWLQDWRETVQKIKTGGQFNDARLGWPFGRLGPGLARDHSSIPRHHAVLVSLLLGWWCYAVIANFPSDSRFSIAINSVYVIVSCTAICRLGIYLDGHRAPISLWGRLKTGRWLISGYDQVFVAPLLAFWVQIPAFIGAFLLEAWFVFPAVLAAAMLVILGMGPSLKEWQLTGNHRIVEGSQKQGAVKVG